MAVKLGVSDFNPSSKFNCWLCGSNHLEVVKPSNIEAPLDNKIFLITDNNYGVTAEIHQCKNCGFLQCSKMTNILHYYEELCDTSYEEGRSQRRLQAKKILARVRKYKCNGRLLDVGAGSGILVEQANRLGYTAEGIEPSKWLQAKAKEHGVSVYLGVLPHPEIKGPYDIIILLDVIEHVPEPMKLLASIHKLLAKNSIVVVVTPDIHSVAARLLGFSWWHFRVAHVGYFNRRTLEFALNQNGFKLIAISPACVKLRNTGWLNGSVN